MISLSSADINAWIAAFFYPLARILGLLATAPPFNNQGLVPRVRLMLGLAIAMAIAPTLPPAPAIDPASGGVLGLVLGYGLLFPQQKVMIFPIPFFIPARIAVVLVGVSMCLCMWVCE